MIVNGFSINEIVEYNEELVTIVDFCFQSTSRGIFAKLSNGQIVNTRSLRKYDISPSKLHSDVLSSV